MKLYFDLDGVIRDLARAVGIMPEKWNGENHVLLHGKSIVQFLDEHRFLLRYAPPTRYYKIIRTLPKVYIITAQPRYEWEIFAEAWIHDYFEEGQVEIEHVACGEDKLFFLSDDAVLFEDSPKLSNYEKIYLIDYPYNRCVDKCLGRITNEVDLFLTIQKISGGKVK